MSSDDSFEILDPVNFEVKGKVTKRELLDPDFEFVEDNVKDPTSPVHMPESMGKRKQFQA